MKRFITKGEQTMSHLPEKLLLSKAIYQLNKYKKAWLNTNLAKTPILFTVEFQELLKYSEKRIASIHGNFLPSLALIHTLRFQIRNRISPGV